MKPAPKWTTQPLEDVFRDQKAKVIVKSPNDGRTAVAGEIRGYDENGVLILAAGDKLLYFPWSRVDHMELA